jgi:hypothetical protein
MISRFTAVSFRPSGMTPSDPTTRALAYWLFNRAVKTVGWCGRKAWEHREEISQATRVAAKAGVAAGRVAAKGARVVYEHREQIAQATGGALRGGATAARHCAAPFSARKQIDAEYQAVRQQVNAYKRLTDRRYEAIAFRPPCVAHTRWPIPVFPRRTVSAIRCIDWMPIS